MSIAAVESPPKRPKKKRRAACKRTRPRNKPESKEELLPTAEISSEIFSEDIVAPLILAWQKAPPGRRKDDLLALFWKQSAGLRRMLIAKIPYLGGSMEPEDIHSELLKKTMKMLHRFDPANGRAFTLCYLSWARVIATLMGKWERSEHISFVNPQEWRDPDEAKFPTKSAKLAYINQLGRMDSDNWMDDAF